MSTAFVLSGGASLGAVQVGMLQALSHRGVRPDFVVGTSVGAINGAIAFRRLEDAPIPIHVVAADVLTGQEVLLSAGPAVDAVLASAAIPGVFPPVEVGGRCHLDGGTVNNTPISHAIALGADVVWVLPTGYSRALQAAG